jgi:hypothetical protein
VAESCDSKTNGAADYIACVAFSDNQDAGIA